MIPQGETPALMPADEDSALHPVVKALIVDPARGTNEEVEQSNALQAPDEEARRLTRAGAIAPPYPPHWLAERFEESSALRPAVEAMIANIDGHGHRFEPRLDLASEATDAALRDALMLGKLLKLGRGAAEFDPSSLEPSDFEVEVVKRRLRIRMRLEKARLDALFSACTPMSTFISIRKQVRRDVESIGNGYLGMRRDRSGDLAEFDYLRSAQMRLRPIVEDERGRPWPARISIPVRRSLIHIDRVDTYVLFRTYVQLGVSREVFFKQFGDPRPVSAEDGRVYPQGLPAGHRPATELYNFQVPSPLYAYGVPRWMNAAPLVKGLRAAEEVNATHFDNNAIPRMMILVSGGTLRDGAEEKIKAAINAHVKGRQNYHSTLILQATPPTNVPTARVQIEVKPLKEAIQGDGLFQSYSANSRDTILAQYRLPKFITGLLDDVNRSTAREGLAFVEDQVFQPERTDFDAVMNMILESEDILYWTFVSNSPVSRDPETVATMVEKFSGAGGPSINDVREQMGEAFNKRYPKIQAPWADMPVEIAKLFMTANQTQAVVTESKAAPSPAVGKTRKDAPEPVVAQSAAELVTWLEHARDELRRGAAAAHAVEVQTGQGKVLMIPMSGDELAELVDIGA